MAHRWRAARSHKTRGIYMFANTTHRLDFADTRALGAESVLTLNGIGRLDPADLSDQMAQGDAADRNLLRLVMCAAAATLVLALASSLGT